MVTLMRLNVACRRTLHVLSTITVFSANDKQNFDVLLTMHLSIILANNQLNAHVLVFFNKFIVFLHMFRALLCSSSVDQIVLYSIWYRHAL